MWSPDGSQSVVVTTLSEHQSYASSGWTHYDPSVAFSQYTAEYPQHVAPATFDISSFTQSFVTTAQSLKRRVGTRNGHRWAIEFTYAPMRKDDFFDLWAFVIDQNGQFGEFTLALPNQEPRGSVATTTGVLVAYNVSKGASGVSLKDFDASETNVLRKGDFIRFDSSKKVYCVTNNVSSDANGDAIVTFFPALVTDVQADTNLNAEPVFNVGLTSDIANVSIPSNETYIFKVSFLERI